MSTENVSIRLALSGDDAVRTQLQAIGAEGQRQFAAIGAAADQGMSRASSAQSKFFADTTRGSTSLVRLSQAVSDFARTSQSGGTVVATAMHGITSSFGMSRIALLELQAAGAHSFDALAAGMNPLRVAAFEGGRVIEAFVQSGLLNFRGVLATLTSPLGLVAAGVTALGAAYLLLDRNVADSISAEEAHKATQEAVKLTLGDTAKSADDLAQKYGKLSTAMKAVEEVAIAATMRRISDETAALNRETDKAVSGLVNTQATANTNAALGGAIESGAAFPGSLAMQQATRSAQAGTAQALDSALKGFRITGNVADLVDDLNRIAQTAGPAQAEIQKLADSLVQSAKMADQNQQQLARLGAEQRLLEGTATAADRALLDGDKRTTTAKREQTSALDEYMQRLQAEATASGTVKNQRAALLAVTEASAKAQEDYNRGLRDSPLLTEAEAATARKLAQDKQNNDDAESARQRAQRAIDEAAQKQLRDDARDTQEQVRAFGQFGSQAFDQLITGTDTWHNKLSNIENDFARILEKLFIMQPLEKSLSDVSDRITANGGFGGFFSSLFGLAPAAAGADTIGAAEASALVPTGAGGFVPALAKGGVLDHGVLVRRFATGDVFTSPTYFGMAGGFGLMAENGPEAVMPLTRLPGGKLGVQSAGGAGGNPPVLYIDARGASNPAQFEAIAHRVVQQYIPGIVTASVGATRQAKLRKPNFFTSSAR